MQYTIKGKHKKYTAPRKTSNSNKNRTIIKLIIVCLKTIYRNLTQASQPHSSYRASK